MGAIGNYVHYQWSHYLKAGTERIRNTGHNAFDSWKSQKQEIIAKAERLADSGVRQHENSARELEKLLNTLMVPTDEASEKVAAVHRKVEQRLQEEFGESLQQIDFATGNVKFKNSEKDYIGKAKTKDIEDIINRINRLEAELIRQAVAGGAVPKTVFKTVDDLKEMYKNALNQLQQLQASTGQSSLVISQKIFDENLEAGRNALNNLIKEYAAFPAIGMQKGKLFEYLNAYAPLAMDNAADVAIGEVIGEVHGVVSYNPAAFDSYFTAHENINGILATTHVSQGKIDVLLEWQEKQLGISAKNVNIENGWAKLVSDSTLLYLLQDEDPQFVNHFLNIFSTHGRKGSNKASLTAFRNRMLEEVKLILFYKALTGDTYGRQSANVFIINDNQTGKVKVCSIPHMIDNAIQKPIKGIQLNGKTFNASTSFKNTWHKDHAQGRISALLADVHSKKVKVSVNTEMFK